MLAFWLCWCQGVLEGSNLGLGLFIELPQCLLFTNGILTVESCLLSIIIWLRLLLFHLLLHVVSIWRIQYPYYGGACTLAAAPWGNEEPVSSVVCGWSMTLIALMALPFNAVTLRVTICFLMAIDSMKDAFEEAFWEGFCDFWERDFEYRNTDLNEITSLWRWFFTISD